jgi:transposase-like protein
LTAYGRIFWGITYAKGMTTRAIADTLQEIYGAEVSPTLVTKVTDAVWETVQAWQSRPLEAVYPILYLDGLVIKVHHENRVINKTLYVGGQFAWPQRGVRAVAGGNRRG